MVKVQLVNGKTVHKSWSNRRKYSRRSVLARKRALRCIDNEMNKEHVLCGHEDQESLNEESLNEEPLNENEEVVSMDLASPSASSSLGVNNQNNTNEDAWNDDVISKNFQVLPPAEYESIMSEEFIIEKDTLPKPNRFPIEGKRVVDLSYVLNWAIDFGLEHSKICTGGKLHLLQEQSDGLLTTLIFECDVCRRTYNKRTTNINQKPNINEAVVWGTLAIGSTYGHSEELFTLADIKFLGRSRFQKIESKLSDDWRDYMWLSMEKVGTEERKEAIKRNQVDDDGVPWIAVFVDGGWSKRTYGHNYDAKSGVAVIIGAFTKKILFLGIRNKYCSVCARASKKGVDASKHICFKNWTGSSTAMEPDILVEGFRLSEEMHNLRYKQFVGDGDSSVYARLRESVLYGRAITKVECTNHVVKNYGKILYSLAGNTKFSPAARKFLSVKYIKRLEAAVKGAISNNSISNNVDGLRNDLQNGPYHVFGRHENCKDYYCKRDKNEIDHTEYLKDTGLWHHIISALELVVKKANRLVFNQTNNNSENYMNIVSRFNSGKRLNLISRGSFQNRCHLAGLRYNSGIEWHVGPWKNSFGSSPGKITKRYIQKQCKSDTQRKARRQLFSERSERRKNSNFKVTASTDENYGPNADDVELDDEELQRECERKLQSLQVSILERDKIANATIGQFGNLLYENERRDRLTASMFGKIIKKRPVTSCHNFVKSTLYSSNIDSEDMKYGKINEKVAIEIFAKKQNVVVEPSGLHIDINHGFLAASPDGLIGKNSLVEIKCVPSVARKDISLEEATNQIKGFFLEISGGKLRLKRNHIYYYQVQGQLNICQRDVCYFVVFIDKDKDIFVENISRDEQFWLNNMLPSLTLFYKECILPEIFLKRIPRGKTCKESNSIVQAKEFHQNKEAKKIKKPKVAG